MKCFKILGRWCPVLLVSKKKLEAERQASRDEIATLESAAKVARQYHRKELEEVQSKILPVLAKLKAIEITTKPCRGRAAFSLGVEIDSWIFHQTQDAMANGYIGRVVGRKVEDVIASTNFHVVDVLAEEKTLWP